MTTDLRNGYEAAGSGWGEGPSHVYSRLSQPLLEAVGDVAGARVLDVGSGAGLLARAVAGRGARVVGTDLAHSMLTAGQAARPPGVVADVRALPFAAGAFDLATAAFVLNHLPDPQPGLRELHRVSTRLLATTFDGVPQHPAKALVDAVAGRFGFVAPSWYDGMRRDAGKVSSPSVLRDAAVGAGWRGASVERVVVRADDLTPHDLAAWRLGMAHLAGFVTSLAPERRAELFAQAVEALRGTEPLVLPVLLLRATRGAPTA